MFTDEYFECIMMFVNVCPYVMIFCVIKCDHVILRDKIAEYRKNITRCKATRKRFDIY